MEQEIKIYKLKNKYRIFIYRYYYFETDENFENLSEKNKAYYLKEVKGK